MFQNVDNAPEGAAPAGAPPAGATAQKNIAENSCQHKDDICRKMYYISTVSGNNYDEMFLPGSLYVLSCLHPHS